MKRIPDLPAGKPEKKVQKQALKPAKRTFQREIEEICPKTLRQGRNSGPADRKNQEKSPKASAGVRRMDLLAKNSKNMSNTPH
ncbi:MAG: hypothetical protein SPE99_02065 [Blautia sp.]|nr:hypothetical protein [Blautia sp.]